MYTTINFKTKKALREAVAAGSTVTFFQIGPFGGNEPRDGHVTIEGPHYPAEHRWYASCSAKDGKIVRVS
jgi:hypothetical protein